jgi:hypothetical protein
MSQKTAVLIDTIQVRHPDTRDLIELYVYQDLESEHYFAVDGAWVIDEEPQFASTPVGKRVELVETIDED